MTMRIMLIYLSNRKPFITVTTKVLLKNHTLKLTFTILFSVELSLDVLVLISSTLRKGIPSKTQKRVHSGPRFVAIFFRSFSRVKP